MLESTISLKYPLSCLAAPEVPLVIKENVKDILHLLPPANEVWGKVICLQACVCPQGGCLLRGVPVSGGVPAPGGCLVETPPPTATAAGGTHPTGMHSCF